MLDRLLDLLALDALPRTGWLQAGVRPVESVAGHSHGVCLLVLLLGPEVDPPLDVDRAVCLAAVHDVPEALLGDLPRTAAALLPPGAKAGAEERAATALLGPPGGLPRERFAEYAARASREARFARVCDRLHLGLRAWGYRRGGALDLDPFRATLRALDCEDFGAAASVRDEILARWDALDPESDPGRPDR